MPILVFLGRVEGVARKTLRVLVVALFTIMSSLVFAQVVCRFVFKNSLTWSEELARFTLIWLIYLASILAYAEKVHISVDALVILLTGKLGKAVQILNRVCVVVFTVAIMLGAIEFIPTTSLQLTPAAEIPMSYAYAAVPVGMAFICLIAIKQIFQVIHDDPSANGEAKP